MCRANNSRPAKPGRPASSGWVFATDRTSVRRSQSSLAHRVREAEMISTA